MRRVQKGLALVLALALCGSLLAGCGGGEAGADTPLGAALADANASDAFEASYSYEGAGTLDDFVLEEFSGSWEHAQEEKTENLSHGVYTHVTLSSGDMTGYGGETINTYYVDGTYYYLARVEDSMQFYRCDAPTAERIAVPGTKLLSAAAAVEPTTATDEYGSTTDTYAFSLSGEELKEVVADACPDLLDEAAQAADWSSVSAEWTLEVTNYGAIDITANSPALGNLLLASSGEADCSEFTLELDLSYGGDIFYLPEDDYLAQAKEGDAAPQTSLPSAVKEAMVELQADIDAADMDAEEEAADVEEEAAEAEEEAASQPSSEEEMEEWVTVEGEGSVTMTCGDFEMQFELPGEWYSEMTQTDPARVRGSGSRYPGFTIRLVEETPEDAIRIYGNEELAEPVVITDGYTSLEGGLMSIEESEPEVSAVRERIYGDTTPYVTTNVTYVVDATDDVTLVIQFDYFCAEDDLPEDQAEVFETLTLLLLSYISIP